MASNMKAMYPITLENNGRDDREKNVVNVNQERLNDNFRSISAALVELIQNGGAIKYLSTRLDGQSEQLTALGRMAIEDHATIFMMPDSIISQVAQIISGLDTTQQGQAEQLRQAVSSLVQQQANSITVLFTTEIDAVNNSVNAQNTRLAQVEKLQDWFRIVARNTTAGTNAGAIIGRSDSNTSFKAEASCIYFYQGDETMAKWANALAGLDANGNFIADRVHTNSMLVGEIFDVDVVDVSGTKYLHIAGRT